MGLAAYNIKLDKEAARLECSWWTSTDSRLKAQAVFRDNKPDWFLQSWKMQANFLISWTTSKYRLEQGFDYDDIFFAWHSIGWEYKKDYNSLTKAPSHYIFDLSLI